jgi:hypothetical protein
MSKLVSRKQSFSSFELAEESLKTMAPAGRNIGGLESKNRQFTNV